MAWGKDNKSFKETFGMEEQEMKDMITKGATAADELKAMKEKLEKLETSAGEVSEIKEMLTKIASSTTNNNTTTNNTTTDDGTGRRRIPSVADDEDGAFAARMAPVLGLALATRAEVVFDRVINSQKYGEILKKDIEAVLAKEPLEARCRPEFVQNAYDIVVARNLDKIQEDNNKREGRFFIEGGNSKNTTLDIEPKDKTKLSDKEHQQAVNFGMTDEEYAKSKEKLQYV